MIRFIAIAAAATLVSVPAFAADPGAKTTAGAPASPTADQMGKRVCVVTDNTGSRIQRKTCKTRGEWIAETGIDPLNK